jgi:hypothetical protein
MKTRNDQFYIFSRINWVIGLCIIFNVITNIHVLVHTSNTAEGTHVLLFSLALKMKLPLGKCNQLYILQCTKLYIYSYDLGVI